MSGIRVPIKSSKNKNIGKVLVFLWSDTINFRKSINFMADDVVDKIYR